MALHRAVSFSRAAFCYGNIEAIYRDPNFLKIGPVATELGMAFADLGVAFTGTKAVPILAHLKSHAIWSLFLVRWKEIENCCIPSGRLWLEA